MFASSGHLADAVKDGNFDIETFVVPSICTACDLQTVTCSTRAETHALIEAAMQSIGCPSPKSPIASASGGPKRTSIYNLGFDQESNNVGMLRTLRTATTSIKHVLLCANWCMFHQLHLGVEVVLRRLHVWEHVEHYLVRYFNGVATLVNNWRSSGVG